MRSGVPTRHIAATAAAMAGFFAAPASHAGPDAVYLQYGRANHTNTRTVVGGLVFDWDRRWADGALVGYWDVSFGAWRAQRADDGGHAVAGQFGVTPVLRYLFDDAGRWFVEIGVGLNVIVPKYRSNGKHFTTAFNFGDHLAVGHLIGERGELALRYQHFSNGGIRHPNPGENLWQVRWSWRVE